MQKAPWTRGHAHKPAGTPVPQGGRVDTICFAHGTRILCKDGAKPVQHIRVGDLVQTKDNGCQPVRWRAARRFDARALRANPHIRPIRIPAGALGGDGPQQDLLVSPQHRVLVSDWRCAALFGEDEMLLPAKALVDMALAHSDRMSQVEYTHFMFDRHEIVFANGFEAESFHPGDFALTTLDPVARMALLAAFPDLGTGAPTYGAPARPVLRAHEALALATA